MKLREKIEIDLRINKKMVLNIEKEILTLQGLNLKDKTLENSVMINGYYKMKEKYTDQVKYLENLLKYYE